jgi:hypothetical protein
MMRLAMQRILNHRPPSADPHPQTKILETALYAPFPFSRYFGAA